MLVFIVRLRSLCGRVGLNKIKEFLTYGSYVTIAIKHNSHAQLLTLQNGIFNLDSCYRVIT